MRGEKIDIAAIEARMGRPLANEQQAYKLRDGGVAVFGIDGVLAPKMNLFMEISGGMSMQMMRQQIESAGADPRVRALVLAIDSPGGSVHGTPELAATIREIAGIKPVVTLASATMASAGYWIGAAANAVYITGPTVLVGSIGIVANHEFNPRAGGRQVTEISAGKYKRIASGNEPLTEEGRAYMQAQIDHIYSVFVDAVAQYRDASAEQVLEHMADGRVFVGQQAINAGLVDGVSSLDALVEDLATNPAKHTGRRKAVFAVPAGPQSKGAGVAPKDKSPNREIKGTAMSDSLTRASFEQEHAALFAQLQTEFSAKAATQERERIQAVMAIGADVPGHDKLLAALAFDGKTTAPEASMAVLKAEGATRVAAAQAHAKDAPQPAKGSAAPAQGAGDKTKAQKVAEAQAYAKSEGVDLVAAFKHLGYAT
ncbi:S49 family peptidase [Xylophilus ampelinus]|uniref:S49 family peptidase n=1 Tax=Xylophilus ampelinus TaxID=54067 RepID=UPI001F3ED535|nr:S49 family peptidase [Xylophilus ampelinus]MCS4509142.1 S49 family peptidase [Xylophilus ampelinus]